MDVIPKIIFTEWAYKCEEYFVNKVNSVYEEMILVPP